MRLNLSIPLWDETCTTIRWSLRSNSQVKKQCGNEVVLGHGDSWSLPRTSFPAYSPLFSLALEFTDKSLVSDLANYQRQVKA